MTLHGQSAQNFYINCSSSGYEALYALDETLQQDDPRKAVLRDLMSSGAFAF